MDAHLELRDHEIAVVPGAPERKESVLVQVDRETGHIKLYVNDERSHDPQDEV
jgi:hypothetical protein